MSQGLAHTEALVREDAWNVDMYDMSGIVVKQITCLCASLSFSKDIGKSTTNICFTKHEMMNYKLKKDNKLKTDYPCHLKKNFSPH